jgi:hypothetical protein
MAQTKKTQHQPKLPGRKPTHRLYRVQGDGDGAIWTPIGAAWPHSDNLGFSVAFDAIPLTGRIVLRLISERAEEAGDQQ